MLKHINLCVRKYDRIRNLYTYASIEVNAEDFETATAMVKKAAKMLKIKDEDIEVTLDMSLLPKYRIEPITEKDAWRGCYKVEEIPNKLNYGWASGYDDNGPYYDDDYDDEY